MVGWAKKVWLFYRDGFRNQTWGRPLIWLVVLKFFIEGGSVVVRPSGTEPKLKTYISVVAGDEQEARAIEEKISEDLAEYMR